MEESLQAKIKVLEGNYFFLQKEHSVLIKGLHEEIEKLQRKYSELAFDYTMRSNKSLETLLLEDKIKQLQNSLCETNKQIESQKENFDLVQARNKDKERKLLKHIEEQTNIIESLKEVISGGKSEHKGSEPLSEKDEKQIKETQTEKIHKRKKKKSATAHSIESRNTGKNEQERSPCRDGKMKVLSSKSKSAPTPSATVGQVSKTSILEHEGSAKKGKREKRNRKKNSAPTHNSGDIPILPSDYRAVVATLPPLSQSHEETKLECDMQKFIPCSSGRHSGFSALKGNVHAISQLHKGLRKPSLKVDGAN
ncbi:coiled-coil domain-containing protein 92-like [Ischnura elegans]|uniref:coiled-coil domain-containing protein 92-like n=1 Tax=Ischnura elegans TaxID=197161 RepID=UPI001ED88A0C|nr:coiled-coil domain-containing protein 92-like [Ischnura elegans]